MDNGTEFKGELLKITTKYNIRAVNGAAYHPQSQGSVEAANKLLKRRMQHLQTQSGTKQWASLLTTLTMAINTTRSEELPRHQTPYNVWFNGRKAQWLASCDGDQGGPARGDSQMEEGDQENQENVPDASSPAMQLSYTPNSRNDCSVGSVDGNVDQDLELRMEDETEATLSDLNMDYLDVVSNPESFATAVGAQEKAVRALELTDIEREVAAHNVQHAQKLVSRSAAESVPLKPGSIATLKVPTQVRLSTEPARLPVRIWEVKPGPKYSLLSEYGQLRGIHAHSSLNPIAGATGRSMGWPIPFHPVHNQPTITLAAAVAAYNKRGSVTAAQRAGRKASAPKPLPALSRVRAPASPEVEVPTSSAAKHRNLPPPLLTRARSRALGSQGTRGGQGKRRGGRGKA